MGPKSKSKSAKTDAEIVIPEPVLVTPALEGADPAALPFPEWADSSLNAEKWDGSGGKDKKAPKAPAGAEVPLFKDPQMVYLPYSIVAAKWKRPSEIYPDVDFTIYVEKPEYPDLISGSKHLLHSEFVRSFISSIETLLYLGNTSQFNIEFISPSYTPTTADLPWRPWHHIYSGCKAGKGQEHSPTVNKIGKYVVRLFWMGSWRKIYVDDLLPVDLLDHVLLPSLELTKEEQEKLALKLGPVEETKPPEIVEDPKKKPGKPEKKKPEVKKCIEIWPFLLSKALLKIASLSWYDEREILDFDIVQCLTGWIPQKFDTKGLDIYDVWDICSAYTNHFCWPSDKSEASTKASKGSKKDKGGKKGGKKGAAPLADMDSSANAHHLLACCNDLRSLAEDEILDISPCWSHYFLIDQTRDIPLLKPTLTADLAFWKRFRWLAWKVEKGLVPAEELLEKIRCFKLVSPFKKMYEHVVYKQPSKMALDIETTVNIITEEVKKGKGKGKDDKKGKKEDKKSSKDTSKKSKSSKGSSKKGKPKKIDLSLIPNPSIWVDYEKLSGQISTVNIYLKPSKFKSKFVITDLAAAKSGKEGKPSSAKKGGPQADVWKNIIHPRTIKHCRNEPIYIFTDSIDYKLIVVNLYQTGYTPILIQKEEEPSVNCNDITECDFCIASLVKRIKRNITKSTERDYIPLPKAESKPIIHDRPMSHLVLEKYNWQTEDLGEMLSSVSTYGSKTTALDLAPGRHMLRLWIKSEESYVLQILSDTPLVIGCLEGLLYQMSQESQLLINMCIEIASNYGKLVQAFGMPEFAIQLKSYYNSYKPNNYLTKAESSVVHDTFYNLLYSSVENYLSKNELRALRILFFRWQFPTRVDYIDELEFCTCYDEHEDVDFLKAMQWYTVRIQAFFRGIYERAFMRRHTPAHKEHLQIFEKLKTIYNTIFSSQRRLLTCPPLLRIFLDHPSLSEIKSKYSISHDIENVITLQEVSQTARLPENDWGLICRQQFFVNSPSPLLVKINLFCDISEYFVRVFDNDTREEIKRYTNNVTVNEYDSNLNGYTILCYGFSPQAQQLTYKLSFALKKEVVGNKLLLPSYLTQVDLVKGNYIPNVNNYICRYLVHVYSSNALVTTRFATCYDQVVVNLKIMDDYGTVIQQATGTKNILLPAVVLEFREKIMRNKTNNNSEMSIKERRSTGSMTSSTKSFDKSSKKSERTSLRSRSGGTLSKKSNPSNTEIEETVYVIEATVVDCTWPLHMEEWKTVNNIKANMLYIASLKETSTGSVRRVSKRSSDSLRRRHSSRRSDMPTVDEPYWVLQTIVNTSDAVQFTKDRRREEEIRNIKNKWYEGDPLRYQMSQELRQAYLDEHRIENEDFPEDVTNIRSLSSDFFAPEILPPYDLSEFMIKKEEVDEEEKDTRKIKTDADFEDDLETEMAILEEFEITHQKLTEDMDNYVAEQMNNFELLNNWYNECRAESVEMMNDALNLKAEYIKKVLDEINKASGDKKGKKDKGAKGGKGKKK